MCLCLWWTFWIIGVWVRMQSSPELAMVVWWWIGVASCGKYVKSTTSGTWSQRFFWGVIEIDESLFRRKVKCDRGNPHKGVWNCGESEKHAATVSRNGQARQDDGTHHSEACCTRVHYLQMESVLFTEWYRVRSFHGDWQVRVQEGL